MVKLSSIRDKLGLLFTSDFTTQEEGDRSMVEQKGGGGGGGKYIVLKLYFSCFFPSEN